MHPLIGAISYAHHAYVCLWFGHLLHICSILLENVPTNMPFCLHFLKLILVYKFNSSTTDQTEYQRFRMVTNVMIWNTFSNIKCKFVESQQTPAPHPTLTLTQNFSFNPSTVIFLGGCRGVLYHDAFSSSVPLISITNPKQVYIFGKLRFFFLFHLIPNSSEYGQVKSRSWPKWHEMYGKMFNSNPLPW